MADKEFNLVGVIKANTQNFERGLDKAQNKNKKFNKKLNGTKEIAGQATNKLDQMTGGAISGFQGMIRPITGAIKGMKGFKLALMSTGIGALVMALGSLVTYLQSSAEGQHKLNKLLGGFKGVVGFLQGMLENLGKIIYDAFSNPKEALNSLVDGIKNQLFNRIKGVGDYFVALQDIASSSFQFLAAKVKGFFSTGDVKDQMKKQAEDAKKGITEGLESGKDAGMMVLTGMDEKGRKEAVDAFKQFGKDAGNAYKDGRDTADLENQLEEERRAVKKYEAEKRKIIRENVRRYREEEKYAAEERVQFIEDAKKENEKLYARKIALAEKELRLQRDLMAMSPTNQADLDKEAELEARINDIKAKQNSEEKELLNKQKTVNNQLDKEVETRQKAINKVLDLNKELQDITVGTELDDQFDLASPLQAYNRELDELREKQSNALSPEEYQKFGEQIEGVKNKIADFKGETSEIEIDKNKNIENQLNKISPLVDSVSDGFVNLFDESEKGFKNLKDTVIDFAKTMAKQLLSKSILLLLQMVLNPTGTAAKGVAKDGFFKSLFGFSGGGITPKKFAGGGMVSGNSTMGDKVPVLANSEEMILNRKQQGNLFRMLDNGNNLTSSDKQQVEFKLKGTELIGVINNVNRKNNLR